MSGHQSIAVLEKLINPKWQEFFAGEKYYDMDFHIYPKYHSNQSLAKNPNNPFFDYSEEGE